MTQRQQGWVRWFDTAQGLGFIKRAAGQADVFVHFSAIRGRYFHNLDEGQQVEFEVVASERGPLADDVVVLAESSQPSATHSDSWAFGHRPVDLDTLPAMLEAHRLFVDSREEAGQQLDLWGADLRGARLRGADLRRAALEGADLEGADLRGADLGRAFVFRAHFGGADLSRASLRRALACEASFVGA